MSAYDEFAAKLAEYHLRDIERLTGVGYETMRSWINRGTSPRIRDLELVADAIGYEFVLQKKEFGEEEFALGTVKLTKEEMANRIVMDGVLVDSYAMNRRWMKFYDAFGCRWLITYTEGGNVKSIQQVNKETGGIVSL